MGCPILILTATRVFGAARPEALLLYTLLLNQVECFILCQWLYPQVTVAVMAKAESQ